MSKFEFEKILDRTQMAQKIDFTSTTPTTAEDNEYTMEDDGYEADNDYRPGMTNDDENDQGETEAEKIECLVEQGFTPKLAKQVLKARSRENLPLTIWIVDNSASMRAKDGKQLVATRRSQDVRFKACSRMDELKETVAYHAQLAALLEAPTKFLILNPSDNGSYPQEFSIAERGSRWLEEDMDEFIEYFPKVRPKGATPITSHLQRIYYSLEHVKQKIVLVLATDGRPTDQVGFCSPSVDRAFVEALKMLQSRAWIVVRLCTNDEKVLQYYQKLDDQLELNLEVLDDFLDEAKEVHQHNPWLSYGLTMHRCREMGMSIHSNYRFLDWLDERPLSRNEIGGVLKGYFGLLGNEYDSLIDLAGHSQEDWANFCSAVQTEQKKLDLQKQTTDSAEIKAFYPWNPIRKRRTHWIDISNLNRHGRKRAAVVLYMLLVVPIVFVAMYLNDIPQNEIWQMVQSFLPFETRK